MNKTLLAEVIQAVHQAQIDQCYSLTIPQLSAAIAEIYDCSFKNSELIGPGEIIQSLLSAKTSMPGS